MGRTPLTREENGLSAGLDGTTVILCMSGALSIRLSAYVLWEAPFFRSHTGGDDMRGHLPSQRACMGRAVGEIGGLIGSHSMRPRRPECSSALPRHSLHPRLSDVVRENIGPAASLTDGEKLVSPHSGPMPSMLT